MPRLKHYYTWNENNITVSSYVPMDVYNVLVEKAKDKAKLSGKYISLSQLIRDILTEYAEVQA